MEEHDQTSPVSDLFTHANACATLNKFPAQLCLGPPPIRRGYLGVTVMFNGGNTHKVPRNGVWRMVQAQKT